MWTTTVGNPASVPIQFACLAHGILLPVGYSDGTGCLFSHVELRGAEGSGADVAEVQMQHSEAVTYEEGVLPAKCVSGSIQAVSDTQSDVDEYGVPPVQCASASNQAVSDTQSEIDERGVPPVQCASASNQAVSDTQSKIDEHGVLPVQCASASNQAVSDTQSEIDERGVLPAKSCLLTDVMDAMAEAFSEVSANDSAKCDVSPASDCAQTSVVSASESAKCDDEAVSPANESAKCDFDSNDDLPLATVAASLQHDVVNASVKCVFTAEDDVPLSQLVGAKVSSAGLTPRKTPKKRRKASKVRSVPKVRAMRKYFKCAECAAWFKFKHTFKKHMSRVHHKYPCPKSFCLDVFLTHNICNLHYQTHCLKHHVCAKCSTVFKHQSVHA